MVLQLPGYDFSHGVTIEGPLIDISKAAESQGKKDKGKNVSINPLAIAAEEDDIVSKGSKHYLLVSRKLGCIVHWPGSQAGVEGEVKEVAFEDVEDVVMAMVNGVEVRTAGSWQRNASSQCVVAVQSRRRFDILLHDGKVLHFAAMTESDAGFWVRGVVARWTALRCYH